MKYGLKIVNARLIDGLGAPPVPGEIALTGGLVSKMGRTVPGPASRVIDAGGRVVSPGFIDLHTHCLPGRNENYLQMGVTLVVGGNCGFSSADIALTAASCPGNCGPDISLLAGHNTIRLAVMGNADRAPSAPEKARMKDLLARAMAAGACGFSSGLAYVPGNYARTEEVAELAKVAADSGGYYATHMRDENTRILDSIRECAEIGRESGLPAHISHLKLRGLNIHGRTREVLDLLDQLHDAGQDITQDQYPYTASCGRIQLMLPQWAQEGGPEDLLARLANRAERAKIEDALEREWLERYGGEGSRVVISEAPDPEIVGRSIGALAAGTGRAESAAGLTETVLEIIGRFPGQTEVFCVFHGISETDLIEIMKHPRTAVASDGWAPKTEAEQPHPRSFGTFPRVLGRYSRENRVLPLEEAIRRMTSLPAARLGLSDRGVLREGARADLVIFEPEKIIDRADFDSPRQYPGGITGVIIQGQPVIEAGKFTGALPGRFVPGSGKPR